jgi:hypothetical protein
MSGSSAFEPPPEAVMASTVRRPEVERRLNHDGVTA